MLPATSVLEKLKVHPALQYLTLDGLTTFTRLASHLKRDILQPQPVCESNPAIAPAILLGNSSRLRVGGTYYTSDV
jgi:hypothetical protein